MLTHGVFFPRKVRLQLTMMVRVLRTCISLSSMSTFAIATGRPCCNKQPEKAADPVFDSGIANEWSPTVTKELSASGWTTRPTLCLSLLVTVLSAILASEHLWKRPVRVAWTKHSASLRAALLLFHPFDPRMPGDGWNAFEALSKLRDLQPSSMNLLFFFLTQSRMLPWFKACTALLHPTPNFRVLFFQVRYLVTPLSSFWGSPVTSFSKYLCYIWGVYFELTRGMQSSSENGSMEPKYYAFPRWLDILITGFLGFVGEDFSNSPQVANISVLLELHVDGSEIRSLPIWIHKISASSEITL